MLANICPASQSILRDTCARKYLDVPALLFNPYSVISEKLFLMSSMIFMKVPGSLVQNGLLMIFGFQELYF